MTPQDLIDKAPPVGSWRKHEDVLADAQAVMDEYYEAYIDRKPYILGEIYEPLVPAM